MTSRMLWGCIWEPIDTQFKTEIHVPLTLDQTRECSYILWHALRWQMASDMNGHTHTHTHTCPYTHTPTQTNTHTLFTNMPWVINLDNGRWIEQSVWNIFFVLESSGWVKQGQQTVKGIKAKMWNNSLSAHILAVNTSLISIWFMKPAGR